MEFSEKLYHADIDGMRIGDLTLYCCGRRRNAPNHSFGPAARDHFWFIYLRDGSGIFEVNGTTHRVTKNSVMVAFPNRRIHYRSDPGSIWSIDWVSISSDGLEAYLPNMHIDEHSPVIRIFSPSLLENIFDSLINEIPRETMRSKLAVTGLLYRLLALMTPSEEVVKRSCIDEALLYMMVNYEQPITVSQAAAAANMERSYFTRMFKQELGKPPSKWLLDYRMERAAELLCSTELSVAEVASSVGFADPLYFSRKFSECMGLPPTRWREKL